MSQCVKCGKTIEQNEEAVYGIIEMYHYDNRATTACSDTGPTTYKPYAIIKSGICRECEKSQGKNSLLKGLSKLIGGVALIAIIIIIINVLSTELEIEDSFFPLILGVALIAGVVLFFIGLYNTIVYLKAVTVADNIVVRDILNKKVPKENVLYPHVEEDLNVEDIPASTYYRQRYYYLFITEKDLRKPITGKGKEESQKAALDTLRTWVKEHDLLP